MVGFDVIKDWFVYEMYIHISYKYSLFVKYKYCISNIGISMIHGLQHASHPSILEISIWYA